MIFIQILISAIHVGKRKIIIVVNVVATDVLNYKKREPVNTELFISIVFITQSYFTYPKKC